MPSPWRRCIEVGKFLVSLEGVLGGLDYQDQRQLAEDVQGLNELMAEMQACIQKFAKKGVCWVTGDG